jgi:dimethylaniline monooxygenase (N-oxide forming)
VVSLSYVKDPVDGYKHATTLRRARSDGSYDESTIISQRVVITTGLHVTPNIPLIPGLNTGVTPKSPEWIHSSEYKSRDQLRGKEVLVLGAGETGMDVGYESVLSPARKVWMGVRGGFLSFPKVLNNFRVLGSTFEGALPIDGLITNLFETAYVHPWVSASHLRWFVSDFVIRRVLWVLTGTQAGCNQWAGELPPERQGRAYVFLNKSAKAMQFINRPHYKLSWLHRLLAHYHDPPLPNVEDPTIYLVPFPTSIDSTGRAIFSPPPPHRAKESAWKEVCRPDLVVLCTGYTQEWSWLGSGYPRGPDECNVRGVCGDDPSVAFIGFLRPGVGAIPPMAEMQVQLWLLLATGRIPRPTTPENYHLLHSPTSRIQYGVDYSTYQATLAGDMGSAPGLLELWKEHGWFVTLIYW